MQRRRYVFLNHHIVPIEQAHISIDDPGFLLGDGVFETCGVFSGVPFLLDEHLKRLRDGLRFVEIAPPPALEELSRIIPDLLEANELRAQTTRIRITVSRGAANEPTMVVTAAAWEPPADLETGVQLDFTTLPVVASPWRQVKSTSRQTSVMAGRARGSAIYDSLQCNTQGVLTEGTYSNLFCVSAKGLLTPRLDDGCLAGVTRAAVLAVAHRLGLAVYEQSMRPPELATMREVILTSSMSGVVPVMSLQLPRAIPTEWHAPRDMSTQFEWAAPGPTTVQLRQAYRSWQEEQICR
jgi:branched-subunit amino acid aminotransferase/4-amino-4-deoxychorismate lyase